MKTVFNLRKVDVTEKDTMLIEKKLTLCELLEAVDANFEGYAPIPALCRNVPKYGSDDAFSNGHVKRISEMMAQITR